MILYSLAFVACLIPFSSGHASIFHPSMYGFNVTRETFPYENRPVAPLYDMTFNQWWFHNHLSYPPNPSDVYQLPVGRPATFEIACNKQSTSYYASSGLPNSQEGDNVCPGSSPKQYHTKDKEDTKGCALAIAYKSDVHDVQPEDLTVFSVNHTCVWTRFTDFQVPSAMPPCPAGGCTCAFFWIHSPDSGSEQMYMNGFKCTVSDAISLVPLAKPKIARRCGADPDNGKTSPDPANCTYEAKQPLYWLQKERNNMFEAFSAPPFYNDLYNFVDGAQNDIFEDSYPLGTRDLFDRGVGAENDEDTMESDEVSDPTPISASSPRTAEVWPISRLCLYVAFFAVLVIGSW